MAKKPLLIGGSIVLLVACVAVVAVVSNQNSINGSKNQPHELSANVKAVKEICKPTDYVQTCESTLTSAAGNISDPKQLMVLAFQVAEKYVRDALNHSSLLHNLEKEKKAKEALGTCWELLDYAIDDLRTSVQKFTQIDLVHLIDFVDDLNVWLSSALTYQETCLDGFEGTKSSAGEKMRKALKTGMELTTNAIAIADSISESLRNLKIPGVGRRLLSNSNEMPSWVSAGHRRLLAVRPSQMKPSVVVAKDGSGDVNTIAEALEKVPVRDDNSTFIIYVKEGVYNEIVNISRKFNDLMIVGDGPTKTKITGNKSVYDGVTTYQTCTFCVLGTRFLAKDLGFENTAGPEKHQAVALRAGGDMSVFYNCQMDGYQDTLYAHTKRQFYRDCTISGTIDFIFGNGETIFQNCHIVARKPLSNQVNIVTAHGRIKPKERTGLVLHNCTITADEELYPVRHQLRTYLARPWKPYSRTVIMQSFIDDLIHPQGWLPWNGDIGLRTCFYAEVDNRGPGSATTQRATWKGVKKISYEHAKKFTVSMFLRGNQWLPTTEVPFIPELLPQGTAY